MDGVDRELALYTFLASPCESHAIVIAVCQVPCSPLCESFANGVDITMAL